jgi:hypothetical protein
MQEKSHLKKSKFFHETGKVRRKKMKTIMMILAAFNDKCFWPMVAIM